MTKQSIIIKIKNIILRLLKKVGKKQLLIVSVTFFSLCVLLSSSSLAYSIKLKSDGDKEYKGQNYSNALKIYEQSKKYWFPELLNYKLRDRDLHTKIDKAKIMVESGESYNKGISAFTNQQYIEAKQYFSSVVAKDPHVSETEKMLDIINKQLASQNSIPTIKVAKPTPLTNNQEVPKDNNVSTPTHPSAQTAPSPQILMPDKPYIDTFCDNKSNCVHSQFADKNKSSYQLGFPTIHVGESLTYTLKIINPKNESLLADFLPYSSTGNQKWSNNLTFTKTFTKDDINTSQYYVNVYIKSLNSDVYRLSSCKDGPCDDFAGLSYIVLP